MKQHEDNNQRVLIPIKTEIRNPTVNWDRSWSFTWLSGLTSEQSSFLFKMLHNILPTKSRLFRLHQTDDPACSLCTSGNSEDTSHALLSCNFNTAEVNNWIIEFAKKVSPNSTLQDIVTLNLDLEECNIYPMIWSLSHMFIMVLQHRVSKKAFTLYTVRATLEAKMNILRKSRLSIKADQIALMLNLM